jgi:hypothetical protein
MTNNMLHSGIFPYIANDLKKKSILQLKLINISENLVWNSYGTSSLSMLSSSHPITFIKYQ